MSETPVCPKCGADLPLDAPQGLCPQCLVAAGLEATAPSPATSSGFEPPSVDDLAKLFPQLDILELLGKGGMGAVYKARQPGLDRLVAVKILPPEIGREPSFAERFTREARAMARLSHPHIVAVHDFGQTDGLFYFVMEYVDGANLRQTIQAGQLKPEEALAIVPQICDALQYAHDEGVVHRDIKPENILLDRQGRVKIADFGLSKLLREDQPETSLTGTHQVMGTLRYMAPEQMEGSKNVDHRADIYSLGVVFYELLTGDVPMGRFDPPSKKVQLDVRLDKVVLRALEQQPDKRYQQASDVKTDMETIHAAQPSASPPESSQAADTKADFDPTRWWLSQPNEVKKPLKTLLGLAFFGLVIIFISFGWREEGSGETRPKAKQVRVFEIGAFDPWYRRESIQGPRDDSSGFNLRVTSGFHLLSWSLLSGVLAAVLLSVLVGIEKAERAARPKSEQADIASDATADPPQHDFAHVYAVIAVVMLVVGVVTPLILLGFVRDGIYHPAVWITLIACQTLAVIFGVLGRRYRLGRFTACCSAGLTILLILAQLFSSSTPLAPQRHSQPLVAVMPHRDELTPTARSFLGHVIAGEWKDAAAEMVSYAMTGATGELAHKAGLLQSETEKKEWYRIFKAAAPASLKAALNEASVESGGGNSCNYKLIINPSRAGMDTPSISVTLRFVHREGRWQIEYLDGGVFLRLTPRRKPSAGG